jgi:Domain of unknown function (DUF5601)
MRETDVWKSASDVEFDNAMEGMEKLVMNRLYDVYEPPTLLFTYTLSSLMFQHVYAPDGTFEPSTTNND